MADDSGEWADAANVPSTGDVAGTAQGLPAPLAAPAFPAPPSAPLPAPASNVPPAPPLPAPLPAPPGTPTILPPAPQTVLAPSPVIPSPATPSPAPSGSTPWPLIIGGALLALVLIGGGFALLGRGDDVAQSATELDVLTSESGDPQASDPEPSNSEPSEQEPIETESANPKSSGNGAVEAPATTTLDFQGEDFSASFSLRRGMARTHLLTLDEGEEVTIFVNEANGPSTESFDSVVRVVDPAGEFFAENDDFDGLNSALVITAPVAGTYAVQVSEFGSRAGDYEIIVVAGRDPGVAGGSQLVREPPPVASSTMLDWQGEQLTQAADIVEGSSAAFEFALDAGEAITIFAAAQDPFGDGLRLDPVIAVTDPSGVTIVENDDHLTLDSAVAFRAAEDGIHTLVVWDLSRFPGGIDITMQPGIDPDVASTG